MKALLAVEVGVAEERAPGPGEGHDGQRHGDRNIHAVHNQNKNLASLRAETN